VTGRTKSTQWLFRLVWVVDTVDETVEETLWLVVVVDGVVVVVDGVALVKVVMAPEVVVAVLPLAPTHPLEPATHGENVAMLGPTKYSSPNSPL